MSKDCPVRSSNSVGRVIDAKIHAAPANLRDIVVRGWDANPDRRPTMLELLGVLDPAAAHLAEEERDAWEDANRCVVCMEEQRTHILIPCGHWCLCEEHAQGMRECPVCRGKVASNHRVFH